MTQWCTPRYAKARSAYCTTGLGAALASWNLSSRSLSTHRHMIVKSVGPWQIPHGRGTTRAGRSPLTVPGAARRRTVGPGECAARRQCAAASNAGCGVTAESIPGGADQNILRRLAGTGDCECDPALSPRSVRARNAAYLTYYIRDRVTTDKTVSLKTIHCRLVRMTLCGVHYSIDHRRPVLSLFGRQRVQLPGVGTPKK